MRFSEIEPYTRNSQYHVDVAWSDLERHIARWTADYGMELDPDFQRPHVWVRAQQSRFVEHILRWGVNGKDLYFNCPHWNWSPKGPIVLVDGKQRLQAVRLFLSGRIRAFGQKFAEFGEDTDWVRHTFKFHVNDLATRAEVLQWYIDLNAGGIAHKKSEIAAVQAMLEAEVSSSR